MPKYTGPEFAHCDRCTNAADQQVEHDSDGSVEALCFECWNPIRQTCIVLHWINRYGRIMGAPGATQGPFNIKHP